MLSCRAVFPSWAKVMPPSALMAWKPRVPSVPPPDRMTPTAQPLQDSGQGTEQVIHGHVRSRHGLAGCQRQRSVGQRQAHIGGNHINAIDFDRHALGGFQHGHGGEVAENAGQLALVVGLEVLDKQKCQPRVGRDMSQQFGEGFQPAGGSADADNREVMFVGRSVRGWQFPGFCQRAWHLLGIIGRRAHDIPPTGSRTGLVGHGARARCPSLLWRPG